MNHFFAYINRMRFIQRWALMRNTAPENVQEHSHQVAVLAHALAVIRNEKFGGHADAGAVAVAALYHDASEILTGDMPTPIKYYNPEIRNAYKAVEQVAGQRLLDMLPPELRGCYESYVLENDEDLNPIVKAADKLSAHIKCLEELKAGRRELASMRQWYRSGITQAGIDSRQKARRARLASLGLRDGEPTTPVVASSPPVRARPRW